MSSGETRSIKMPVSYTNRKGLTYMLYRGQTRKGKPRYYFGRPWPGSRRTGFGDPTRLHDQRERQWSGLPGQRPSHTYPARGGGGCRDGGAAAPQARRYRVAVKDNRIVVYE